MGDGHTTKPFAAGAVLAVVDPAEGTLDETGKGILSEGSRLAKKLGVSWAAVCLSRCEPEILTQFGDYGTPRVLELADGETLAASPDLQACALAEAAHAELAGVVLLPHTDLGQTLAPLLAAQLDAALFCEALSSQHDAAKGLKLTRAALGAQAQETRIWDGTRPLVLSLHPRILSAALLPSMGKSTPVVVELVPGKSGQQPARSTIIERIAPDPQTVDVSEAEVIFSAGLGCDQECFAQLLELCKLLNVSLGVTRPVYDLGWTGFERMVGQTGKTVAPRLYVALGISGSMHHIGGIKDSRRVISVNLDPKVPMFPNSDEGFVADLNAVMPLLLEKVKAATGGAA